MKCKVAMCLLYEWIWYDLMILFQPLVSLWRGNDFLLFKWMFSLSVSLLSFCSNDKNLCSKALLSGVKAYSKADLIIEAEGTTSTILKPDLQYFYARPAVMSPVGHVEKGMVRMFGLVIKLLFWLHLLYCSQFFSYKDICIYFLLKYNRVKIIYI